MRWPNPTWHGVNIARIYDKHHVFKWMEFENKIDGAFGTYTFAKFNFYLHVFESTQFISLFFIPDKNMTPRTANNEKAAKLAFVFLILSTILVFSLVCIEYTLPVVVYAFETIAMPVIPIAIKIIDGATNCCYEQPSTVECGNRRIESGEYCDDGNTASGDGCSSDCRVESCQVCTGEPSECYYACEGCCLSSGGCKHLFRSDCLSHGGFPAGSGTRCIDRGVCEPVIATPPKH